MMDKAYYFDLAKREAVKSKCINMQVGCVIISDKGNVLAVEHNKDDVAAEIIAISQCHPYDLRGSKMYIAGFKNGEQIKHYTLSEESQKVIKRYKLEVAND